MDAAGRVAGGATVSGAHLLDLVLVLLAAGFAVSGYRQGFVTGVLSLVGFAGGGFLGTQLAPPVAVHVADGNQRGLVGLVIVLGLAAIGQVVAVVIGQALRSRLRHRSARRLDSLGGAAVSAVAVLLVAWLLATPLASSRFTGLAAAIRQSQVIAAVNRVVPDQVVREYAGFRHLLDRGDFPDVFGPLAPTDVAAVPAPDAAAARTPGVRAARRSIVKVVGEAPSCSRRLEGSGFVIGADRVLTNAHVVAGVRTVVVGVGGQTFDARVVLYDPGRDVAVLAVPGLDRPALRFAGPASAGTSAVVAGYPLDGGYSTASARIRSLQEVRGPDIYNDRTVTREIYALRSKVRSGNSGGPLLSTRGTVYGVVFAAAADDPSTGFALSAGEVSGDVRVGLTASDGVSTEGCD